MRKGWLGPAICCVATLLLGLVIGSSGLIPLWSGQPSTPPPNPAEHGRDSLLYMQTAAEYEACCLQAYQLGKARLEAKLAAVGGDNPHKLAVVMDLDETVLDNSRIEAWFYLHRMDYKQNIWNIWEKDHAHDIEAVPGATDFIAFAESKGVTVVYISNRLQEFADSTVAALDHLKISTRDIRKRLLLKQGEEGTSNKSARREQVEKDFRVLLFFGDNLRDFHEEGFVAPKDLNPADHQALLEAIIKRKEKVRAEAKHWGDDWIILPNPVYGEWMKLLGDDPAALLGSVKLKAPEGK